MSAERDLAVAKMVVAQIFGRIRDHEGDYHDHALRDMITANLVDAEHTGDSNRDGIRGKSNLELARLIVASNDDEVRRLILSEFKRREREWGR